MMRNIVIAVLGIVIFVVGIAYTFRSDRTSKKIEVVHTVSYSNAAVFLAIKDAPELIERRFVADPGKHVESPKVKIELTIL